MRAYRLQLQIERKKKTYRQTKKKSPKSSCFCLFRFLKVRDGVFLEQKRTMTENKNTTRKNLLHLFLAYCHHTHTNITPWSLCLYFFFLRSKRGLFSGEFSFWVCVLLSLSHSKLGNYSYLVKSQVLNW